MAQISVVYQAVYFSYSLKLKSQCANNDGLTCIV